MCEKMYLCTFKNDCPIGEDEELYNCCEVCETPCENACYLNRNECTGLVVIDANEFCAPRSCYFPSAECGVAT